MFELISVSASRDQAWNIPVHKEKSFEIFWINEKRRAQVKVFCSCYWSIPLAVRTHSLNWPLMKMNTELLRSVLIFLNSPLFYWKFTYSHPYTSTLFSSASMLSVSVPDKLCSDCTYLNKYFFSIYQTHCSNNCLYWAQFLLPRNEQK